MAPHKCVYIAFATRNPDKFDISLNGIQIKTDNEVNFLGLRLDNHLTFCNHVNHLRLSCYKRIDIIRVISSKRWHLLAKTRKFVYHSLVRSLMEYACFIYELLPGDAKRKLIAIQNNALRIIYNQDRFTSTQTLLQIGEEDSLKARLDALKEKYFEKAIKSRNPVILKAIAEYKRFSGGRNLAHKTIFCTSRTISNFNISNSDELYLRDLFKPNQRTTANSLNSSL